MTLVCGLRDEPPVEMLMESLDAIGAEYLLLHQKDMADRVKLCWTFSSRGLRGHLKVGEDAVDVREIGSVFYRLMNPEDVYQRARSQSQIRQERSILFSLMNLFDLLDARVVNPRRPMMSNNSKPYQAMLIKEAGFAVPETLVTNRPQSAVDFLKRKGSIIYKSLSSERSIVSQVEPEDISRFSSLPLLPTQFQKKIEGLNVRVHVVGKEAFATRIITKAIDYRYASRANLSARFTPYELTDDLRRACLRLSRKMGLRFSGIDLIVNPERVYCLEVNPCPGYSYYQEATGQPISDALAEYLAQPCVSGMAAREGRAFPKGENTGPDAGISP